MSAPLEFKSKEGWLFHRLDIIASILGLLIGLAIFSAYYLFGSEQRDVGVTIFLASLVYLLLRKRILSRSSAEIPSTKTANLLINITFWLLYIITVSILYLNLYFRPTSYFILISLMAGIIGVEIMCYSEGRSILPIFLKIIVLSINIQAGIWYNFPTFSGSDVYWHASICEMVANSGYVPPFEISNKYYFTPLSYTFVAIIQILCQQSTKDSIFVFAVLVSILMVFVYLIGRDISGPREGLLAALVLSLTNSVIQYAFVNYTPSVLCFCYFLVILYLLFKIVACEQYNIQNTLLLIFLSTVSIFTHQLSSFVILTALFSVYIMYLILEFRERKNTTRFFTRYLSLLVIVLFFQWFYSLVTENCSFFEFVFRPFVRDFLGDTPYEGMEILRGAASTVTFLDTILTSLPYTFPVFFAIGGVLLWLNSKDFKKLLVITPIIILYAIIYSFPMLGMRNLLTDRWMPFLSVFLCLVIAAYILNIANISMQRMVKVSIVLLIMTSFCFVMVITPGINKDNPIINKDATVRNQFTSAEVAGMDTLTNIVVGPIKSDSNYFLLKKSDLKATQTYISMSLDYVFGNELSDQTNTLIAIRRCGMTEPFAFNTAKRGISEMRYLPEHFLDKFDRPQYDLIYDNKEVVGYLTK